MDLIRPHISIAYMSTQLDVVLRGVRELFQAPATVKTEVGFLRFECHADSPKNLPCNDRQVTGSNTSFDVGYGVCRKHKSKHIPLPVRDVGCV